ncbi:MAG: hypothetical protein GF349_00190 [Candidatus Magasanikbacteria bacterium]|nr:hypothetical protein [Candidatus Magasanikbacteria bacterium]
MSILSLLFGSSSKYPQTEKQLSIDKIKELVSQTKVKTLNHLEETLVEKAIIERRRGDGRISLRQIDEVLTRLKKQNKISKIDKGNLMSVFVKYYSKL